MMILFRWIILRTFAKLIILSFACERRKINGSCRSVKVIDSIGMVVVHRNENAEGWCLYGKNNRACEIEFIVEEYATPFSTVIS